MIANWPGDVDENPRAFTQPSLPEMAAALDLCGADLNLSAITHSLANPEEQNIRIIEIGREPGSNSKGGAAATPPKPGSPQLFLHGFKV